MKTLFAAAVLFFQAGSVMAGSCRPLEYAELKDTSTKDLISTYCSYGEKAINAHETAMKLSALESDSISKGLVRNPDLKRDIEQYNASSTECFEQRSKINSALRNRSAPPEPSCEKAQNPDTSRK